MERNRSDKTLGELQVWIRNNSPVSDLYEPAETLLAGKELLNFLGEQCSYPISKEENFRSYLILVLKDATVMLNESFVPGKYIANSLRSANQEDVLRLSDLLQQWECELKQKRNERNKQKEEAEKFKGDNDVWAEMFYLSNQLGTNVIDNAIERLEKKIYFVLMAIHPEKEVKEENNVTTQPHHDSLYYSEYELEKIRLRNLEIELRSHEDFVEYFGEYIMKFYGEEISKCPACKGEKRVLETELGLVNRHFYQTRICYFCWGGENPFKQYVSMNLEEFHNHIQQVFLDNRLKYHRIWKRNISKRSRIPVDYILFNSRYDMMSSVSEVYNIIFALLKLREVSQNNVKDLDEKWIADMLLTIRDSFNQALFLDGLFPLLQFGCVSHPKIKQTTDSLEKLVEKYRELKKVVYLLDGCWKNCLSREWKIGELQQMQEELAAIDVSKVDAFQEGYQLLEKLIKVQYYMQHTGMELEDYKDTDSLDIPTIMYFCRNHPNSPFRKQEINEKNVKKWIKEGLLVGRRQGKYYVYLEDLLSFFAR